MLEESKGKYPIAWNEIKIVDEFDCGAAWDDCRDSIKLKIQF